MDMAVSGTQEDIAVLLGIVATISMTELKLVTGDGLGAIVEMGAYFQRTWLGTRRRGVRCDRAT